MPQHVSVKEAVFPFGKFAGVDIVLGPGDAIDRRSDGHQRAVFDRLRQEPVGRRHGAAAARATIFISVADRHKEHVVELARRLAELGFSTAGHRGHGRLRWKRPASPCRRVKKLKEGHPNLLDYLADGAVPLVMNTPSGKGARTDEGRIRAAAVQRRALHHHAPSRRRRREGDGSPARRRDAGAGAAGSVCVDAV